MPKVKKAPAEKQPKARKPIFDYGKVLDETERSFGVHSETFSGSKLDQSISSGMLCIDLLLGNGGWVPGWNTSLGFEQSAKTTTAIHALHKAYEMDIPVLQLWDYEKSFSAEYTTKFWGSQMDVAVFGERDEKGNWTKQPRIRPYDEHTAEIFFDTLHATLKKLPKKRKVGGKWYLIFEDNKNNRARIGENYNKVLHKQMKVLAVECEDGRPQGFIMLDSYPAMLPDGMDGDEAGNAMAKQARMFSEQIKRVQGLIGSRGIVLLGINQMRKAPGVMMGNPEYEPCGEALKLASNIRLLHKACAVPSAFNWGEKGAKQHISEKSFCTSEGGVDTMRYITIDVEKNKMGGAPKGTRIYQRIWASDFKGEAKGLDPSFDTWQYLILTGQAEGTLKKFTIDMPGNPLHKKTLDFGQLKALIVGDTDVKKKVAKKLKLDKNPKIRESCQAQVRDGSAYVMFGEQGAD